MACHSFYCVRKYFCLCFLLMHFLGTSFGIIEIFTMWPPKGIEVLESEYIPQSIKFIPIIFSVLGAF